MSTCKFKEMVPELKDQVVMMVWAVVEEEGEVEMEQTRPSGEVPGLYSHMSSRKQQQLVEVRQSFPSLFQERPGRTKVVTQNIIFKDTAPIRQNLYRVTKKTVDKLKTEIEMMLQMGIIEPLKSEWSSSILLVPKKDGALRFCTDFRKLNSVSCFDSYSMTCIDEMIETLGNAHYMTTLDLCKGYWQVPLNPSCKPYTAFHVPQGYISIQ